MRTGLSLSFCIKDIIEGKVRADDVRRIETGTCLTHSAHWMQMAADYCRVYWKANPVMALDVLACFLAEGKIDQPKTRGERPRYYAPGQHWLLEETS